MLITYKAVPSYPYCVRSVEVRIARSRGEQKELFIKKISESI